jgi:L-arabinokinase
MRPEPVVFVMSELGFQSPELAEFERLLTRPNSDPTGLAGFFNPGQIWVARVPARLDVMGGIADYSGANVCEAVLGSGNLIALQPRTDRTLRIRTTQMGPRNLPVETRIPLDYLITDEQPAEYREVREACQRNPLAAWASYIGGSIFTMLREEGVRLPYGFSMLLLSGVPMNVGIGSSAATEVGTICCLNAYLNLGLDAARIARLAQIAENHVVGAPCGSMDQIAVASGRIGCLTHILCRPGSVEGSVEIPPGTGFVGINSMVRHSVGGHQYGGVRIGAFMGKRIINAIRSKTGGAPVDYLTAITSDEWCANYRDQIPEEISGTDFLSQYRTHDDPVTTVQPGAVYRVRGPAEHAIMENDRVLRFMESLKAASAGDESALVEAGLRMYEAHESYRVNCRLSVPEVDSLVDAVRELGPAAGLYGAKITGGGSGGTVAVFGKLEALEEHIPRIAKEYSRRIGEMPDIFTGTSPGAVEFRARRYSFDASGWSSTLI